MAAMRTPIRTLKPARRRRKAPYALLLAALLALAGAAGATLLQSRSAPGVGHGPGQPLTWHAPEDLPDWARDLLAQFVSESDHQIQIALADLNRDQRLEVLIAPASKRYDVFIPDLPLRLLTHQSGRWQVSQADVRCRPHQYGSFLTAEFWDLQCRNSDGPQLLRWNGRHYTG